MIIWRLLGAIGRTLITAGVLILLFVAYQLWGTGIQEDRAQKSLDGDFSALIEQAAQFEAEAEPAPTQVPVPTPNAQTVSADGEVATPQPTATPAPLKKASIPPELLYRDEGEVMARILIDAINVDKNVVSGTSVEPLRLGPGHYASTVLPGQPGNASIAGHRTTYGAPFHRIDELVPGDQIKVQTIQGVAIYEVDPQTQTGETLGYFIVDPSATQVLGDFGDNRLTLTACHPKYSAAKRIIVTATLVTEPFEFVAPPDAAGDGGLQGDEFSDIEDGSTPENASEQIISDEVAIDDDPSVTLDENGNVVPVDSEQPDETAAATPGDSGQSTETAPTEAEAENAAAENETETAAAINRSPADEDDDFGEGLNGDRSAIVPSITWALAAAFIWLAAWFIGTRWRKWPMYVVGITPFVLTLWLAFVHIDQALPSY